MKAPRKLPAQRRPVLSASIVLLLGLATHGCSDNAAPGSEHYSIIHSQGPPVAGSTCALFQDSGGDLYGATQSGSIFRMDTNGTNLTVVHALDWDGSEGSELQGLIEASDGALYGTATYGGLAGGIAARSGVTGNGTVFKLAKDGTGFVVLHRFTGHSGDGSGPYAGVVEGKGGALYGTTLTGGTEMTGSEGLGVVFKVNKDGSGYKVLHRFGDTLDDGFKPFASLLAASDGNLYGVTDGGGASSSRNGTVFRISPDGSQYRVLHSFPNRHGDGRMPRFRLVEGTDGALYGTTEAGGKNDWGTVFKLNKDGTGYRILHSFTGYLEQRFDSAGRIERDRDGKPARMKQVGDGAGPLALVPAGSGTLYGTTQHHGAYGAGTLYRINPDGSGFSVVHHFNATDGDGREGSEVLTVGRGGNIYGGTRSGGLQDQGTIFKLTTEKP